MIGFLSLFLLPGPAETIFKGSINQFHHVDLLPLLIRYTTASVLISKLESNLKLAGHQMAGIIWRLQHPALSLCPGVIIRRRQRGPYWGHLQKRYTMSCSLTLELTGLNNVWTSNEGSRLMQ